MYGSIRFCVFERIAMFFSGNPSLSRKFFDVLESHCLIFCESDSVYIVLKPGPFMTCSLKPLIRLHYICYLVKSRPSVSIVWGARRSLTFAFLCFWRPFGHWPYLNPWSCMLFAEFRSFTRDLDGCMFWFGYAMIQHWLVSTPYISSDQTMLKQKKKCRNISTQQNKRKTSFVYCPFFCEWVFLTSVYFSFCHLMKPSPAQNMDLL